eukprot:scaffold990_cov393-Prasinococcus_capsulatus_cf.AAC.19
MYRRVAQLVQQSRKVLLDSPACRHDTTRQISSSRHWPSPRSPKGEAVPSQPASKLTPEQQKQQEDFVRGAELAQRFAMPWETASWGEHKGPLPWYTTAYWTVFAVAVGGGGGYQVRPISRGTS